MNQAESSVQYLVKTLCCDTVELTKFIADLDLRHSEISTYWLNGKTEEVFFVYMTRSQLTLLNLRVPIIKYCEVK